MFGELSREIPYLNLQEIYFVRPSQIQQFSSSWLQSLLGRSCYFWGHFFSTCPSSVLIMRWHISLISSSLVFSFHSSLPNPKTASSAPLPTPHTSPLAFPTKQAVYITIQGQRSSIFSQRVEGTERTESLLLMTQSLKALDSYITAVTMATDGGGGGGRGSWPSWIPSSFKWNKRIKLEKKDAQTASEGNYRPATTRELARNAASTPNVDLLNQSAF